MNSDTNSFWYRSSRAALKNLNSQRGSVTALDIQIEIQCCGICHSDLHATIKRMGQNYVGNFV